MTVALAIVLTGLGTYASRAVFIVAFADRTLPPRVEQALEYVGPATLAALVATLLLDGSGSLAVGVPEAAALAVGAAVAWRFRNLLAVVAAGMGVFWVTGLWF
ncbi:AzlD domain-containing protein [Nocardioides panacisoli]|uniref:AzlD domain-containing protein n=1 Tax=Nocardioides panacisoli TaxID=627624 RepID=UPI001C62A8F1|nr:AzlD domain-containing protein [Nocardioides panacisoli]QYJ05638.1 AzlD domain-containing protein [Nocardioides panacisoli]